MARNPKNAAGAGESSNGNVGTLNLTEVQGTIEAANEQRSKAVAQLREAREGHVAEIENIDTMLSNLGEETENAGRGRGKRRAGTRGTHGRGAPKGKRDPLGLRGYIARALVKAGSDGMKVVDLTAKILADGWPNPSETFNTQVYQICGKMVSEGTIKKSAERGVYAANAKTQKFLDELQESIKAKAKAAA